MPLDQNGMPVIDAFKGITQARILENLLKSTEKSSYVYTIMASPLKLSAPPFCLCIFGTNNRFQATQVKMRNDYIRETLSKVGITVIGTASDGDPRLLKYMKHELNLGSNTGAELPPNFDEFYFASLYNKSVVFQDTLHIMTKMRKALICINSELVIGNYPISVAHLVNLVRDRPRGEHHLVLGDIFVKDQMNVGSVLKLINPVVSELVEKYYDTEGKGLVLYLKVIRCIYDSFESRYDRASERIRKISYATMFLRIWKNLEKAMHFISLNAYTCVEINFHSLISIYRELRDTDKLRHFLPYRFSSQPCEEFFRTARSFTTSESTVINFSTYDFLHKIKRIQTATELKNYYSKKSNLDEQTMLDDVEVISDDGIAAIVFESMQEAALDFLKCDITPDLESCFKIGIKTPGLNIKKEENSDEDQENDSDDDMVINESEIEISVEGEFDDDLIHECSGILSESTENNPNDCFRLTNMKSEVFEVKKGQFLYAHLNKDYVSTDRMYRFMSRNKEKHYDQALSVSEEDIRRDEWAIFDNFRYVCHILKIKIDKKFFNFVNREEVQRKPAYIYCMFYTFYQNDEGHLILKAAPIKPRYLSSYEFKTHIPSPTKTEKQLVYFDQNHINLIENLLQSVSLITH